MKNKIVVKRRGKIQDYDEKKVYASVYAAAINCEYGEQKSERIALFVTKKVTAWVKSKASVTSESIRKQILRNIKDKDIKLMYKHHLDIC